MVKIAIAGAGEVAREIIDALIAAKKHDLVLLTRKEASTLTALPNSKWIQVDYSDKNQLTEVLRGTHTVLCFISADLDEDAKAQKNLIDASISAGCKRFAPSEWATSSFEHMHWYENKGKIREYLKAVNKDGKVLEYCLFQPGLFTNYFTHPYKTAKHVTSFEIPIDFQNRRAIVADVKDLEDIKLTLTTAQDLANVMVKAIEYDGEWPMTGGIKGSELSITQLIRLGEEIRGGPFAVEKLKVDDLKAGVVKSTWLPRVTHSAIPPDQVDALAGSFLCGITLGMSAGVMNVSDEWNQLFPEYKFMQPSQFLSEAWQGKP